MLAANVSDTVTLVTAVLGTIGAIATVLAVVFGVRYRVVAAVERAGREAATELAAINHSLAAINQSRGDTLEEQRNEILRRLDECRAELLEAHKAIARLEALPNLERVLELIGDTFTQLGKRAEVLADRNDRHAEERHKALLTAINELPRKEVPA